MSRGMDDGGGEDTGEEGFKSFGNSSMPEKEEGSAKAGGSESSPFLIHSTSGV